MWSQGAAALSNPTAGELRLLERMVLNLIAADNALSQALLEPFVEGSQGQLVEHPGYKIAARCDEKAMAFARQLRLTPLARSSGRTDEKPKRPEDPFDALDEGAVDEIAQARQARRRRSTSS